MPTIYDQLTPPPSQEIDQTGESSLTQQQFAAESDINNILAQYGDQETVFPDTIALRDAAFGNFAAWESFEEIEASLVLAQEAFMTVPAATRARFNNDLATMVTWLANPANYAEATNLGLISGVLAGGHVWTSDPTKANEFKAGPPADPNIREHSAQQE